MSPVTEGASSSLSKAERSEALLLDEYRDIVEMEGQSKASVTSRIGDDLSTFWHEQTEKGHRAERLGALVLGGMTQLADRGRAMVFVLPTVFERIGRWSIEHGWNGYTTATASALAVGGTFAAWGWLVGKAFDYSLKKYPKTTERFIENHPVTIGVLNRAVGGFPTRRELREKQAVMPAEGYDVSPYDTADSLLGKMSLAVRRGLKGGFLYGTTAHVGVARANQHSDESNQARRRVVTAESSVMLGAVAALVSTLVTHNALGLAQDIKEVLTDATILRNVSIGSIVLAAISNKASRMNIKRKAKKLLAETEE